MKKSYIIVIWVVLVWLIAFFIKSNNTPGIQVNSDIEVSRTNINLGLISMKNWLKQVEFEIKNPWTQPIKLIDGTTSCMCTKAYIEDSKWNKSPEISMSMKWDINSPLNYTLEPWVTAKVVAIFDPNAHWPSATWPISREIYINTSSKTKQLVLKFNWEVVK